MSNSTSENAKYELILDELIKNMGGKEACVRQLIPEGQHRSFIEEYKKKNREQIMDQIKVFYDDVLFLEQNIMDVEISNTQWNKYIMKLYFYDSVNLRIFEFYVGTNKVSEFSLFEAYDSSDSNEERSYSRSFYSKLKNGNMYWDKYNKMEELKFADQRKLLAEKNNQFFTEYVKKFDFMDLQKVEELGDEFTLSDKQYGDGKVRYIRDNIYYYKMVGIDGYITFNDEIDIMLNNSFALLFYENIIKPMRKNSQ